MCFCLLSFLVTEYFPGFPRGSTLSKFDCKSFKGLDKKYISIDKSLPACWNNTKRWSMLLLRPFFRTPREMALSVIFFFIFYFLWLKVHVKLRTFTPFWCLQHFQRAGYQKTAKKHLLPGGVDCNNVTNKFSWEDFNALCTKSLVIFKYPFLEKYQSMNISSFKSSLQHLEQPSVDKHQVNMHSKFHGDPMICTKSKIFAFQQIW